MYLRKSRNALHCLSGVILAIACLWLIADGGMAQEPAAAPEKAAGQVEATPTLELGLGRAHVYKSAKPFNKVAVSDPKIADIQVVGPDQVVIVGKAIGTADLIMWSDDGWTAHTLVQVSLDPEQLKKKLAGLFPKADLKISRWQETVVLQGTIGTTEEAKGLHQFMDTAGLKYVDMTRIAGGQQVMIKVRMAEASRTALRSLSVNALHSDNEFFGGSTIGGNPNRINIGVPSGAPAQSDLPFVFNSSTAVSSAVTVFTGIPAGDLEFFVSALERNQYIRLLAEPTLVARSGEEASFLAGGEFPIPVVQSSGGAAGGSGSITIQFKEFGVRLRFKPTVMGEDRIQLFVAPEVSELSDIGAIEQSGIKTPAISTRRAETTFEVNNGPTFAMAGLIKRDTSGTADQVPGLGNIPVLGSLFRSVSYKRGESELVVLVTVSLVEPLNDVAGRPLPGDLHTPPSNWELYAKGRIEGRTPESQARDAQWMKQMGLDRLHGPGAWMNYNNVPSTGNGKENGKKKTVEK